MSETREQAVEGPYRKQRIPCPQNTPGCPCAHWAVVDGDGKSVWIGATHNSDETGWNEMECDTFVERAKEIYAAGIASVTAQQAKGETT